MKNIRPILFVNGIFLVVMAFIMSLPMLIDWYTGHPNWLAFFQSIAMTSFVGVFLILMNKDDNFFLSIRQTFVLTVSAWIFIALFAALPFYFSTLQLNFTDAMFESMSGITTTGATILSGLDAAPKGILLWRALLQWLGGIGVIVMALSILPFLGVGGMQLFRTEFSDNDKVLPRAASLAGQIALVYFILTFLCVLSYGMAGMELFDAICHAMTTLATGGYSTSDGSIGYFQNPSIEVVSIVFMILGCIPFILFVQAINGRPQRIFQDHQVHGFMVFLVFVVGLMTLYLYRSGVDGWSALRLAAFNLTSIISGTGYATTDFHQWGVFATVVFFFAMMVGGCAGSATCGIKIFRFQVLGEVVKTQMKKLIYPNAVFTPKYNNKILQPAVYASVMSFFFVFVTVFCLIAVMLSMTGMDLISSLSGAAAGLANVGPGLGETIGPASTYQSVPMSAKWILLTAMLLGRLELFTVLVLFVPHFWRD